MNEPREFTREASGESDRRTGFVGIGEFFLQKGLFVLKKGETCKKQSWAPHNQKHLLQ